MAKGNRGGKRAIGSNKPDTSYQGKQFAKASGTGNTVDMMVDKLQNLAPKVLQANQEAVAQIQKVAKFCNLSTIISTVLPVPLAFANCLP